MFDYSCFSASTEWPEDRPPAKSFDLRKLPTAPRAARGADVDVNRLPKSPPYTAFLGNLPYDIEEEDVQSFFKGLKVNLLFTAGTDSSMEAFFCILKYLEFVLINQMKWTFIVT